MKYPMALDEAISHCDEIARDKANCNECRMEHYQLYLWLKELKEMRGSKNDTT